MNPRHRLGTPMTMPVPSPTTPGHARTTEYLQPSTTPAAASIGTAAGPTAEQVEAARRVYEAGAGSQVSEAWSPPSEKTAEAAIAIQRATWQAQPPRIEELPTGRKWEAARRTGAALGRLEAYFENRARQFVREFAIAFEKQTSIQVPQRLKTITQLDRLDVETRKYMGARYAEQAAQAGAKLGKTIYIKIRRPIAQLAMRQYNNARTGGVSYDNT